MTLDIFKRRLSRQELETSLAKFDSETAEIAVQITSGRATLPDLLAKEAVGDLNAEEKTLLKKIRADQPSLLAAQEGRDHARQRIVRALELTAEAEEREDLKRIHEATDAYRQKAGAAYNKVGAALRAVEVALGEADAAEREMPPEVEGRLPSVLGARAWVPLRRELARFLEGRRVGPHELFEPLARTSEAHSETNDFFIGEALNSIERGIASRAVRSAKRAAAGV